MAIVLTDWKSHTIHRYFLPSLLILRTKYSNVCALRWNRKDTLYGTWYHSDGYERNTNIIRVVNWWDCAHQSLAMSLSYLNESKRHTKIGSFFIFLEKFPQILKINFGSSKFQAQFEMVFNFKNSIIFEFAYLFCYWLVRQRWLSFVWRHMTCASWHKIHMRKIVTSSMYILDNTGENVSFNVFVSTLLNASSHRHNCYWNCTFSITPCQEAFRNSWNQLHL